MADDDFDVELFFENMKEKPELWDQENENYYSQVAKNKAWTELTKVFFDESEMAANPKECRNYLQTKWKELRYEFLKSLEVNDEGNKCNYEYSKKYLEQFLDLKSKRINESIEVQNSYEVCEDSYMQDPDTTETRNDEVNFELNKCDDEYFLLSLLPYMQMIDDKNKFDVRKRILQVVYSQIKDM